MKKKVIFKVHASFEIGFGHIRRCISLANVCSKFIPKENILFYCECPSNVISEIIKPYPFIIFENNYQTILNYIKKNNVDVLVLDELRDNLDFCSDIKLNNPNIKIIALDYFNYENKSVDIIINLFNHNRKIQNPENEITGKYYQGLDYAIIDEGFNKYIEINKAININVEQILVTFGGSDINCYTIKVLELLRNVNYSNRLEIIIGPFFKKREELMKKLDKMDIHYKTFDNILNIQRHIIEADLGFIGCGTTLLEFCSLGTPAIIMPQNKREYYFAKFFQAHEAAFIFEKHKKDYVQLNNIINDKYQREKISQRSKKLVDGKGTQRITDVILSA